MLNYIHVLCVANRDFPRNNWFRPFILEIRLSLLLGLGHDTASL